VSPLLSWPATFDEPAAMRSFSFHLVVALSAICLSGCLVDAVTSTGLCSCDDIADDSGCIQFEPVGATPALADQNCSTFIMTCSASSATATTSRAACPGRDRYATCVIEQSGATTTKLWYTIGGSPYASADNAEIETECADEGGSLSYD